MAAAVASTSASTVDDESRELSVDLVLECGARLQQDSIVAHECPRFKRRTGGAIDCPYPGQPFGEGGVLHSIGTDRGTKAWSNPHTDGKVVAEKSTYNDSDGGPHKFVGRSDDGFCFTDSQPNSWMSVDLGEGRAVVPTHYCLRNDSRNSNGTAALRNWSLQGRTAEPGADWVQIRRHDNDETLAKRKYSVGAWPIEGEARAFRHFRIHQHGKNAYGNDQLMCCGFEVYGTLTEG